MFQNLEWFVSVQTTALSQGIRHFPSVRLGLFPNLRLILSGRGTHQIWSLSAHLEIQPSLCRTRWRKAIPLWNQQMQFEFQTLSSEERADSSRLTLWSSSVDHTPADSHTPGSPATLVQGSYQLLREGPLGAEASMCSVFFTLCHP